MGRRQGAAITLTLAVLVVVALATTATGPRPFSSRTVRPSDDAPAATASAVQPTVSASPTPRTRLDGFGVVFTLAEILLVVVAIAVTIAIVLSVLRRTNPRFAEWSQGGRHVEPPPVTVPSAFELAEVVDRGLTELERGPVSDAIVVCWLSVERAAVAAGLAPRPEDTATEFTERVVASFGTAAVPLRELAALYREARFSDHALPETARQRARECLTAVRTEIHARA